MWLADGWISMWKVDLTSGGFLSSVELMRFSLC